MTAENAKDFLPLVQALADGKTIQNKTCDGWVDLPGNAIAFSNYPESYRIKPEPREWDMWVTLKGILTTNSDMLIRESIRVREILD
jgi:hypothetical protein